MNISYNEEFKEFSVTLLPSRGETFTYEVDTDDEYAVMARAAVNGAMTLHYAGFIPKGSKPCAQFFIPLYFLLPLFPGSVPSVAVGTAITWTCDTGWGLDGKDYGPQTMEVICEEGGIYSEPEEWLFCQQRNSIPALTMAVI